MSVPSPMDHSSFKKDTHPMEATLSPTSVVVPASVPATGRGTAYHTPNRGSSFHPTAGVPVPQVPEDDQHEDVVGSPTSVTMVCSSSSATLLPTAAAANATPSPKNKMATASIAMMPKPFFVMDWLEEINPQDLELARQMLNTPSRVAIRSGGQQQTLLRRDGRSRSKLATPHQQCPLPSPPSSSPTTPPSASSPRGSIHPPKQPVIQPHEVQTSINLPTLNHKDENSVCRQLYPAASPSITSEQESLLDNSASDNNTGMTNNNISMSISRTTSATSVSTAVSSSAGGGGGGTAPTTPKESYGSPPSSSGKTAAPAMSPFKKRSIAIGNGWNAKGLAKAKKGSWESALACWENALEIRSQVLGETHPDVANTCNNIGIALGKLGRYDEAIEILERALELRAKHYGTREHVEVAATLHNIGNVLHAAQDCAGAIQCFWDAKLLQEQLLGPHHVQVARACVAIANVYYEAQQYEDAREAYRDALQVFMGAGLSEQHPEILAIQQDLRDIDNICLARYHQQQQEVQYPPYHMAMAAHQHQQMYFNHHDHGHQPNPQQHDYGHHHDPIA